MLAGSSRAFANSFSASTLSNYNDQVGCGWRPLIEDESRVKYNTNQRRSKQSGNNLKRNEGVRLVNAVVLMKEFVAQELTKAIKLRNDITA